MKRQFFNSSVLVLLFSLTIFSSCQSDQESVVPATSSKSNLANRSGLVPKGRLIINNLSEHKFTFDLVTLGFDIDTQAVNSQITVATPVIVPPDVATGGFTIFSSYLIPDYNYYGELLKWKFKNNVLGTAGGIYAQDANDTYAEPYDLGDPTGVKFVHWDYLKSTKHHQEIGVYNINNQLTYGVDADVTILLPEHTGTLSTTSETVVALPIGFEPNRYLHITTDTYLVYNEDGTVDTFVKIKSNLTP
jgi:hypothetical protein